MSGTIISIRGRGTMHPDLAVSIDGQEYPFALKDPFSPEDEQQLEWYFERYLSFPFTNQVKAHEAAASVHIYGERLFDPVFDDRGAYSRPPIPKPTQRHIPPKTRAQSRVPHHQMP